MSAIVYQSPVAVRVYSIGGKICEQSVNGVVTAVHGPLAVGPNSTLYCVAPATLNKPLMWTLPPKG